MPAELWRRTWSYYAYPLKWRAYRSCTDGRQSGSSLWWTNLEDMQKGLVAGWLPTMMINRLAISGNSGNGERQKPKPRLPDRRRRNRRYMPGLEESEESASLSRRGIRLCTLLIVDRLLRQRCPIQIRL